MVYEKERQCAEAAVEKASKLAVRVAEGLSKNDSITKDDRSPVTIADFGAQALIISAIKQAFPQDNVVGEEDADGLRNNDQLRSSVWATVRETGGLESEEAMLAAIDKGKYVGGPKGRMWALDPIDGTKGFLRGGQFAVCLALVVDGLVQVGVIGCPNLEVRSVNGQKKGILFSTVKGQKAWARPLFSSGESKEIKMNTITDPSEASFCESVESGHSSHEEQALIAKSLEIKKPSVRMDSQAKYCIISCGDGDIYLRLPVSMEYEEKIWDHAAGSLLVEEAGGRVTDMYGNPLDFGRGRTLSGNKGVIASHFAIHDRVLDAVSGVLKQIPSL